MSGALPAPPAEPVCPRAVLASESIWLELLDTYLPKRYRAATAHIVDSKGVFSDQIDVVVFDRQY